MKRYIAVLECYGWHPEDPSVDHVTYTARVAVQGELLPSHCAQIRKVLCKNLGPRETAIEFYVCPITWWNPWHWFQYWAAGH